ncbi:hypothetical protein BC829DRAFT_392639 [Chytridium lagenaria]|nr:hypothetical protein BC829DRAFT_392639 [Chytridium lagenaria]
MSVNRFTDEEWRSERLLYFFINTGRIEHLYKDQHKTKMILHYGDLTDSTNLPTEIYNLADVDAVGTLRSLTPSVHVGLTDFVKFYQASTSELYGKAPTAFSPVMGFLFNHESPRRGLTFVTRKITRAEECMYLGNIDAKRDWGHARDYVEQDTPEDFVLATGETHTVREFVEKAFKVVEIEIEWKGEGEDEVGINKTMERPKYYRPTEVDILLGDASKAKKFSGGSGR